GRKPQPPAPVPPSPDDDLAIPEEDARFDSSKAEAARTLLDLPHGRAQVPADPGSDWSPEGYPRASSLAPGGVPPAYLQPMRPPGAAADMPGASPHHGLEPTALPLPPPTDTPPLGQFTVAPGSSSGPAIPVPTRHG